MKRKKNSKIHLLALGVLASITACSDSETLEQTRLSSDNIEFHADLNENWAPQVPGGKNNASSRAAEAANEQGPITVQTPFGKPLYLHTIVDEGIRFKQQTRGAKKDNLTLYDGFAVTAIYKKDGRYTGYFTNEKTQQKGTHWELITVNNTKWPWNSKVSFHAYAPHSAESAGMLTVTEDINKVSTKITYEAKADDITHQPDLIVATASGERTPDGSNPAVNLTFNHALTAVNFSMTADLATVVGNGTNLEKITISGISDKGELELAAQDDLHQKPVQTWTVDATRKVSYEFDLRSKNITAGQDVDLTTGDQTLMMIPQKLTDAKVQFVMKIKGGASQTFTMNLGNQEWVAGKSVKYLLSANYISQLAAADLVYPTEWNDPAYSFPKKAFTTGDIIGLYVVNPKNEIEVRNMSLQFDGQNWRDTNGQKFLQMRGYKYFAYYPYNYSYNMDFLPSVTPSDAGKGADAFFAPAINSQGAALDQSNVNNFLISDFQVGEGVIDAKSNKLQIKMKHKMGLAVLNLKTSGVARTREFQDNSYLAYYGAKVDKINYNDFDLIPHTASNNFVGTIPYKAADRKYLHIIPLGTSMQFMANDEAGAQYSRWGKVKSKECHITPTAAQQVVVKDIKVDKEFIWLSYNCSNGVVYIDAPPAYVTTFTAPAAANYFLECWGASGGGDPLRVPRGGYSNGYYQMAKGDVIYTVCGGQGGTGKLTGVNAGYAPGGYGGKNGGGLGGHSISQNGSGHGGGGATHIALVPGWLEKLEQAYKEGKILMIAGGAGGGTFYDAGVGVGGGVKGGVARINASGYDKNPATQDPTSGYKFGQADHGADAETVQQKIGSGGGGGGLRGGLCPKNGIVCTGGGGSGYINTDKLTQATLHDGNGWSFDRDAHWADGNPFARFKGYGYIRISWPDPTQ